MPRSAPHASTAVVVLGCRVDEAGPSRALERRLRRALAIVSETGAVENSDADDAAPPVVLLSGGKLWQGKSEARSMAEYWMSQGGPHVELLLEEGSEDTLENAEHSSELLRARGISRVRLVTCDFHMARAALLFREHGLEVDEVPARHERSWFERKKLAFKEWGALRLLRYKRKSR